jgi:DNA-binding response OmpR family regulator
MPAKKLLCVSFDEAVSETRHEFLRDAGYAVTSVTKVDEAIELLAGETFDAVIIGHRFPRDEKRALATMARENCGTPVVLVRGPGTESDVTADAYVYVLEGTQGILKAVQSLLARSKAVAA